MKKSVLEILDSLYKRTGLVSGKLREFQLPFVHFPGFSSICAVNRLIGLNLFVLKIDSRGD